MNFMVEDTNNYDILLGLYFLTNIGIVVDIKKGMIQIRHGLKNNIHVMLLNMVNMLQIMSEHDTLRKKKNKMKHCNYGGLR